MRRYLDIVKDVLSFGRWKGNRTGIMTKALPNMHFVHNFGDTRQLRPPPFIFDDFPLLTTKRVAFKTMSVELEGFINGMTDKRWYQERGCKIWNEWSNPTNNDNNDLGPFYGYQWRRQGVPYHSKNDKPLPPKPHEGYDQLANIVHKLKHNPNDRRMVCSAWWSSHIGQMALPPCHYTWCVTHINGYLSLHWTQR